MNSITHLSEPAPRRPMHTRTVRCEGYQRDDGLWDIEASIIDLKLFRYTEPMRGPREIGSEVHHMAIRLTIGMDMVVRAIEVVMPSIPYPTCSNAIPNYQGLVGRRIDRTWRATVQEIVGTVRGCTHARELLFPMATTAFQTLHGWREDGVGQPPKSDKEPAKKPDFIGGCLAWDPAGPVVARLYPQYATQPDSSAK